MAVYRELGTGVGVLLQPSCMLGKLIKHTQPIGSVPGNPWVCAYTGSMPGRWLSHMGSNERKKAGCGLRADVGAWMRDEGGHPPPPFLHFDDASHRVPYFYHSSSSSLIG